MRGKAGQLSLTLVPAVKMQWDGSIEVKTKLGTTAFHNSPFSPCHYKHVV